MDIKIHSLPEGAEEAEGIVVIIDVLRACTTIPILFDRGAKKIIPVRTPEEATSYECQGYILIGEGAHGSVHDSFHFNNSPSEIRNCDFTGKTLVLRSNNATQAILNANKASDVVLASFVNLDAVVRYIQNHETANVTLVPLGRLGEKGIEDELCAEAIQSLLEKKSYDFQSMRERIRKSECAVLVRDVLKKSEDVEIAPQLNSYPIVPHAQSDRVIRPVSTLFKEPGFI